MKKKLFIIAVLAIGMAACLGSCKKKTTEPTTDPTTEYVCKHDSLIHVMAVEPTDEENGCIEHYKCAGCGKTFADAQGTTQIEETILWATNYVVDGECIAETQFAEYAGEESYMLQACRSNLGGMGDEGTLWNDYTGWENWTDAQWQAYWEKMKEYYVEWGGEDEFSVEALPIASCIFSSFLSKVINNKTLDKIDKNLSAFFKDKEGGEPDWGKINEKLDNIMAKLSTLQNDIKALSDKITLQNYQKVMAERYEKQVQLDYATTERFRRILNIMKDRNSSYSNLPQEDKNTIKSIVDEWHSKMVGGTDIENCAYSMTVLASGRKPDFENLPTIYDYIAEHTIPWEHKGYAYREMTRSVDVVLMAECYLMNLLYYVANPSQGQSFIAPNGNQERYNLAMTEYVNTLNKKHIVYHDYFICQIPGAKVNVKKYLKSLETYEYLRGRTIHLQWNGEVEKYRKWLLPTGSVSQQWHRAVYQYYEKIAKSQGKPIGSNFLYDTYREIGFKNVPSFDSDWIIADCNCDWNDPDVTAIGEYEVRIFRYYIKRFSSNNDWLGFHTVVGHKDGGYKNMEAITGMDISGSGGHEILENGTKISTREFYAMELYK